MRHNSETSIGPAQQVHAWRACAIPKQLDQPPDGVMLPCDAALAGVPGPAFYNPAGCQPRPPTGAHQVQRQLHYMQLLFRLQPLGLEMDAVQPAFCGDNAAVAGLGLTRWWHHLEYAAAAASLACRQLQLTYSHC